MKRILRKEAEYNSSKHFFLGLHYGELSVCVYLCMWKGEWTEDCEDHISLKTSAREGLEPSHCSHMSVNCLSSALSSGERKKQFLTW